MHIITGALIVKPEDDPIFSERATSVELADDAAGPFVEVIQSGRADLGKIAIEVSEWPTLRSAIDTMIETARALEAKE